MSDALAERIAERIRQAIADVEASDRMMYVLLTPDEARECVAALAAAPAAQLRDNAQGLSLGADGMGWAPEDIMGEAADLIESMAAVGVQQERRIMDLERAASPAQPPAEPTQRPLTGLQFDLCEQARADLAAMLQDDAEVTLYLGDGHSGRGLYAWATEYPEEGSILLHASPQQGEQDGR